MRAVENALRVNQNRRSQLAGTSSRRKLRAATGETLGRRMQRWWHRGFRKSSFSICYGLFLLPVAWVLSLTFFHAFQHAALDQGLWAQAEFRFFAGGALVWVLLFFGSIWATGAPWPLHVYVFGHELTHAVWVWLMFGQVFERKMWSADGGYIVTNRSNFIVALAPYFYPLYSLVIIVCYGVASLFYDVAGSTATLLLMTPLQWLFFLLGVTWSFHLTFTVWMIPKGQTDLSTHGTFFSLVVIYLMNLLLLTVSLIVVAPEISFASYWVELRTNAEDLSEWAWKILWAVWLKAFA